MFSLRNKEQIISNHPKSHLVFSAIFFQEEFSIGFTQRKARNKEESSFRGNNLHSLRRFFCCKNLPL